MENRDYYDEELPPCGGVFGHTKRKEKKNRTADYTVRNFRAETFSAFLLLHSYVCLRREWEMPSGQNNPVADKLGKSLFNYMSNSEWRNDLVKCCCSAGVRGAFFRTPRTPHSGRVYNMVKANFSKMLVRLKRLLYMAFPLYIEKACICPLSCHGEYTRTCFSRTR